MLETFAGNAYAMQLRSAIVLSQELAPPCFVLVEASTDEGKTEAALYLADASANRCRALPSQPDVATHRPNRVRLPSCPRPLTLPRERSKEGRVP
ncbi:MAG: hypothetical protein AAFY15_10660, partial [Cyanobacteria bacterium J06648_11]